jgi:hypothetical protein
MDPNRCLKELLALAANVIKRSDLDPEEQTSLDDLIELTELGSQLAEHVQNLDQWLYKGGFMPRRWAGQDGARR